MNAVLVITRHKKQIGKVTLDRPLFLIGRSKECDLRLEEDLASKQHAEIVEEQGHFWVRDRSSTNGTTMNGKKLTDPHELKDGDEIGIGSCRIKFLCEVNSPEGDVADEEATRPARDSHSEQKAPGQNVIQKADPGPLRATVRIVEGPLDGGKFQNWEGALTIGRGLENHVVLIDDAVSTRHARIVQEGERYFIEDLNSFNGTFLDGVKVQRVQLANGQKVKVGVSTLIFELVDLRQRRRLLKLAGISVGAVGLFVVALKLLLPPDRAGQHLLLARTFAEKGELSNALSEYALALKFEPNRFEAKQGQAKIKAQIDARDTLIAAQKAAAEEKYDKAKELLYRVLHDFPKHARALEFEAVLKSIEGAEIAFKARNWSDAANLLEIAREKYPKSQLLAARLDKAQRELLAQQSLAKAKDALQHQQPAMAESFLGSVATNSVYIAEARELLDKIEQERKSVDWLNKANSFYRQGQLTETLGELAKAFEVTPDNSALQELQSRVRKMEGLAKPLAAAEALKQTNSLDSLLAGRKACDEVLILEPDPLNALRKRAQDTRARLAQWLHALAQNYATQGEAAAKAGDRRKAFNLYLWATKADETTELASQGAAKLQTEIVKESQEFYRSALKFEELGFIDKAQENYRKVVEVGLAGIPAPNDYYEKTLRKLRQN